ncbi:MAG: glycerate kinase [Bacteroidota bacterium]
MKVLIAPNAFKGSLSAIEVADAIAEGLQKASDRFELIRIPIADGGEGTVDVFEHALGGTRQTLEVSNAVGEPVQASYLILPDGNTAVFELAAASGLGMLPIAKRSPMRASTFGTGQLILDALDKGCRRIILGLGGSATSDVGTGILQALGVRFLNEAGYEVPTGGGGLGYVEQIDTSRIDARILSTEILIPCDVANTLLGEAGSARVYAPQKGATQEQVENLEENLTKFNEVVLKSQRVDMSVIKHGGAAGGCAAGLKAFLDAKLVGGTEFLLEQIGFHEKLAQSDALITAEGRLDRQTLEGKGPYGVALAATKQNKPTFCITGQIPQDFRTEDFAVFNAIFPITTRPMTLEEAVEEATSLVSFTARQVGAVLTT